MLVGTSQVDITPRPGVELLGFAVRPQPSDGVLDPLSVRGLYVEDGTERLLWLHADLLALDNRLVSELRRWTASELGIPGERLLLSTTHTHSAPVAIPMNSCGQPDPEYMGSIMERFQLAARAALVSPETCHVVTVEGNLDLGVDRRRSPSAHTDPRVGAVGFHRDDGSFKAVLLSYSMHPVCLRGSKISADWPGETARLLSESLPGAPTVLVSSGACGNIDPPEVGVSPEQMRAWGASVAESVLERLSAAATRRPPAEKSSLKVLSTAVPVPLEDWTAVEIVAYANRCLADPAGHNEFGEKFDSAVESWRSTMLERIDHRMPFSPQSELFGIAIGGTVLLSVNAEIFSHFTTLVRNGGNRPIYPVGCGNGMIGYVPCAAAYDEGAYEVEWSMLFYNVLRPRRGGLEMLAEYARRMVEDLTGKTAIVRSQSYNTH
jgi:neutral ceramidase